MEPAYYLLHFNLFLSREFRTMDLTIPTPHKSLWGNNTDGKIMTDSRTRLWPRISLGWVKPSDFRWAEPLLWFFLWCFFSISVGRMGCKRGQDFPLFLTPLFILTAFLIPCFPCSFSDGRWEEGHFFFDRSLILTWTHADLIASFEAGPRVI